MQVRCIVAVMGWSLGALVLAPCGYGQAAPARAAFEVSSVKLDSKCEGGGAASAGPSITPGRIHLPCTTLRALIRIAYGGVFTSTGLSAQRVDVLGGAGWLDSSRYTITAKAEGNAAAAEMMGPMLQSLLEERFQVKVHKEAKETPVYALTVAKGGPKMPAAKEGSCTPMDLNNLQATRPKPGEAMPKFCGGGSSRTNGNGMMVSEWYGVTMAELAGRMLTNQVDRPVVDQTGITGTYDIHLEFAGDGAMARSGPVRLNGVERPDLMVGAGDAAGRSIFVALQEQLGLKLSPVKGSVDVIVIDRAEKPTEN